MGNLLLDRRTPSELAARAQVIEFKDVLALFPRLTEIVRTDLDGLAAGNRPVDWRAAEVTGRLEFGFADAQRALPALTGTVRTTLDAVCQRCLAPMRLPVAVELGLLFADGETTAAEPGEFEVWELDEPLFRPVDLVEECLIMALPFAAVHEERAGCREPRPAGADPLTVRPFADLRSQMEEKN
ncbi:MAG: DUF177 domain-containing protein [Woeseiaceae bacterium]|nr:DUF177 domain-containing protein [Woeseiaceae bacterium]